MRKVCLVFYLLSLLLSGCIKYPRFTRGEMPSEVGCAAVLPLVYETKQDELDDIMGQYLQSKLIESGFSSTLGPKEIREYHVKAGIKISDTQKVSRAAMIGKALGADGVIFGSYLKVPLERDVPTENIGLMIGVDLYFLNVVSGGVSWIYTTRQFTSENGLVEFMSSLSNDIVSTLLARIPGSNRSPKSTEECWQQDQIKKRFDELAKFLGKSLNKKTEAKAKPEKMKDREIKVVTGAAKPIFDLIHSGKPLVMRKLFVGRSSQFSNDARKRLQVVANALKGFKGSVVFDLESHMDSTDNSNDDFWLSAQRAGQVREILENKTPELKGRIQIVAKGGGSPLVPNINERSKSKNRRIILKRRK